MSFFSAGVGLAGDIMQAEGQRQEAQAYAQAEQYNIAVAKQEIEVSRVARKLERRREKEAATRFTSTQQAMFAKAGVRLEGSPLDVMEESAKNMELDILINDINQSIDQSRLESEITLRDYQAREAIRAGKVRAGVTLLTGAARFGTKIFSPV